MNTPNAASSVRRVRRTRAALVLLAGIALTLFGCQVVAEQAGSGRLDLAPIGSDDHDRGILPSRATAFDEDLPGIAQLDPELRAALQRATQDAKADNVEIYVNSGWRSAELQNQLLDEAIAEYGSREEAALWVATAETSAHVSGAAVDVGELDAYLWLSERDRGSAYGLCQIYANEPWHFEYVAEAMTEGCPEQYLDPTHDPRMRE